MSRYKLYGGPLDGEVVESLPPRYDSHGVGHGVSSHGKALMPLSAKYRPFRVVAERDGSFWLVRIPEIDGATQARTREEIEAMARDYISITLDLPKDSFAVDIDD